MQPKTITVPSFAKINLHLQVMGRRDDGYHELCTVFQTVSLNDTLTFEKLAGQHKVTSLTCSDPAIPTGGDNIVVKAAERLREAFGISEGIRIHLEKRIPSPGGLGGGSSNAAVTLMAAAKLWNISTSRRQLAEIAASIGSDVPYFLYGGTCLGTGRGTEIEELPEFGERSMILVTPDVQISTREAFAGLGAQSLTNGDSNRILQICRFASGSRDFSNTALTNDFETTVLAAYPEVARVKQTLLGLGARQALLSGSGASVFGIFDKEETRQAAMKALDSEVNWRRFAVAAISREHYREALEQVF